jgi:hypothetical protein
LFSMSFTFPKNNFEVFLKSSANVKNKHPYIINSDFNTITNDNGNNGYFISSFP